MQISYINVILYTGGAKPQFLFVTKICFSKIDLYMYKMCIFSREGFNLLLYGFGSKRQIINDFRTAMLEKECALVINGFFPGLTLKEVWLF